MSNTIKNLLILVFIPLLLTVIWFRGGLITGGGEEGILYYNPIKVLQLSTSVWIEYATGFSSSGWLSRSPVIYLAVIFDKIGIPAFIFQLALFYIVMVVGVTSVYYLTLNFLDQYKAKHKVALISATFYLLNPFTMSQVWGRGLHPQYFSFALLPLSLLLFMFGIKKRKYFFAILIALSSSLFATAFGMITFIIVYWIIPTIYLVFAILTTEHKLKLLVFGIKFILLTFTLWFLINSWWLIPFFASATSVYSSGLSGGGENLGTLMGVSQHFTPDLIIRLLQKTYFFSENSYGQIYSSFPFQLISLIPLIFVLIGFVKIAKDKDLKEFKFFLVLLILGLLVSLGANPPFGWLFIWIFKQVAILQAFRNPFEKFGLVYVLGYAPIFAFGLVIFSERLLKHLLHRIIGFGLILVLVSGIYLWPMWTGRVIGGQDGKVGISIPSYYRDLNERLNSQNTDNYRTFMTPLMSGDGAVFWWENRKYSGVDPMVFIFDQTMISNSPRGPFYYDFMQSIRKYMDRMNVIPSLSLLRTKYLVGREDPIMISKDESEHEEHLTKLIHPALGINDRSKAVCQDIISRSTLANPAWLVCPISEESSDWGKVKYLHVIVKTDVPATLEVAVRDINENRPRWDGRADSEYSTNSSELTTLTIPLGAPTEYTNKMDYSNVKIVEVLAHPIGLPQSNVDEVQLKGIWLDEGKEEVINEFKLINQFGKLNLYEPLNFNPAPEFGLIASVERVNNFKELFQVIQDKRDLIDSRGFILSSQNQSKNVETLSAESKVLVLDKSKISATRYWLKLENKQDGYVILSKTFDPGWKIVQNISKDEIKGGFISDLKFLKKTFESEDNHFVINGYANLWRVNIQSGEIGIMYIPQVIADISSKVSIFGALIILGSGVALFVKKKTLN